jgi:hypothetical protein
VEKEERKRDELKIRTIKSKIKKERKRGRKGDIER